MKIYAVQYLPFWCQLARWQHTLIIISDDKPGKLPPGEWRSDIKRLLVGRGRHLGNSRGLCLSFNVLN